MAAKKNEKKNKNQSKSSTTKAARALAVTSRAIQLKRERLDEPADEDGLTPGHYDVLRAHSIDGRTQEQIARELGISARHVRRLLREANDSLGPLDGASSEELRSGDLRALAEVHQISMSMARSEFPVVAAKGVDLVLRVIARRGRIARYAEPTDGDLIEGEVDGVVVTQMGAGGENLDDEMSDDDIDTAIAASAPQDP